MLPTFAVNDAVSAAAVIAERLPENLSDKAILLYEAMREVGVKVSHSRGYCAAVSVVHFFVPGEIVADALCMARSTLYVKLAELKAADLIDARAHYVTYKGRTVADGMVWAVKMQPERQGPIKVPYDALKKSYRCLSADIDNGRTAFREIGQSKETSTREVDIDKILAWADAPSTTQQPDRSKTVRFDLEQILDVPYAEREARNVAVDGAAKALSACFGDSSGLNLYRFLIWQLLRVSDSVGADYWHTVYEQARRVAADSAEGFARKPGALFVSRLRATAWWDEVMRQPLTRVGTPPS